MRILQASSELHPYSKSGGLADMVGALSKALATAGHRVGAVTPLYRGMHERFPQIKKLDWWMELPLGPRKVRAEVWTAEPMENLTIYFIHQPEFYFRNALYTEKGFDYADNAERFVFLSKAVVHLARYLPLQPEIVHVHDWQVGLVPILLLHQKWHEGWGAAPHTVLTIHNLAYQGHFVRGLYALTNLPPDYFNPFGVEFHGGMNCLKAGLSYADMLTTVSPRYAREITTEALGCRLDGVLRRRKDSLVGILNGVDYDEWKTTDNPYLRHSFSATELAGKTEEKIELQKEMQLPPRPEVPLFSNITRLADQKGVDIQLGALEEMLSSDMQFILLGSGSPLFEKAYQNLARRYPDKVSVKIGFDQGLSHRIEAGSDFFLMPSRFEPCGLNQMYSKRYGTIPVVRATGGLDDSVVDINDDRDRANGIKFSEYSARALSKAMRKALALYQSPDWLTRYRHNAMKVDFSWARTQDKYLEVYKKALE